MLNTSPLPNDNTVILLRKILERLNESASSGSAYGGFLVTITGLTGGGAENLDGIITSSGISIGAVVPVIENESLAFYQIQSGTDSESLPGIVRPNDFNFDTNPKIWRQVL